jgi:hypothetical protein
VKALYRSSYESLVDDADYQLLSPLAQAVFHTLKLKLGQYGIAVFYLGVLEHIHARSSRDELEAALRELEAPKPVSGSEGWIRRERNVCWLVNGLRFDPFFTASNANNRKGAITYARSLPKVALVEAFLSAYGLADADGEGTPSPTPSPSPSPTPLGSTETETEKGVNSGSGRSEQGKEPRGEPSAVDVDNPPPPPANGPLAVTQPGRDVPADDGVLSSVPVRRFVNRFYPDDGARRRDVLHQLAASLSPGGASLDRGRMVRATDLDHLERCCDAVLSGKPLRDPDRAIRVLLLKLRDGAAHEGRTVPTRSAPAEHQPVERPLEVARTERRPAPPGAPTSIRELLEGRARGLG